MKRLALILALTVLAMVAPACPAMADPNSIKHCQTLSQPGAYVLEKSLSASGDCLMVAASNVSINLAGFAISGNGSGAGITDGGTARSGLTVRNGVVTGFTNGIDLHASTAVIIEGVIATSNSNVGIFAGAASLVRNNVATSNGTAGGSGGIRVQGLGGTVSGNIASGNYNGIMFAGYGTVTGNTASENSNDGIDITFGSTLSNNTASNNTHVGLSVDCPTNMVGNTAIDNGTNFQELGAASPCGDFDNLKP
jgi:parallel beta-helix repeat protein